ncbi:MAG TPA: hypothetical protein VFP68_10180 [Burkholderiaceae bacterium]|nr:hypothetical protein [Burkholderiaceae bacterium]
MNNFFQWLAAATALGLPLLATAQPPSDPADGKPASPLRYPSAFADYKPWQDIRPGDWRQLNDNLRPAPGGDGHAGDRAAPTAAHAADVAASAPATSAPAVPTHQGGHMHGGQR